jgi:membrane-bound lytic murein transglycosylase F
MSVANDLMKSFVFVAFLLGVLAVLWELPTWEKMAVKREIVPRQVKVDLPTFDTQMFLRHVKTRFPRYRDQFKRAGEAQGIPWTLLAAQGYQESRWNRNAMSPTGVRGLMMLTRATASDLGVENRLDPHKSIAGGAQYLAWLHRRIPEQVSEPDRTFMALAAYNVGMGHVKDARILAARLNKNPNKWHDLKKVLPLLGKKDYYKTLPHRYARGWEPVHYVKRIRAYRILLEHFLEKNAPQKSEL